MRLEDCTKDELIYAIQNCCLFNVKDAEFDILACRSKRAMEKGRQFREEAKKSLQRYTDIMTPHAGKSFPAIPDCAFREAGQAMKQWKAYNKKADCEGRKVDQAHKRMLELSWVDVE